MRGPWTTLGRAKSRGPQSGPPLPLSTLRVVLPHTKQVHPIEPAWHQRLRWSAGRANVVGGCLGANVVGGCPGANVVGSSPVVGGWGGTGRGDLVERGVGRRLGLVGRGVGKTKARTGKGAGLGVERGLEQGAG
ncbi:hypothetical protein Aglo01_57810 [Actinokineospora globicatena]|nr:hypothetical protein Aglo01_57810 [Actinokineospora globicatena]GLW88002.1 hypothetical protein Aglo02_56410 [Actinokineospora globicatena]